MQIDIESKMIYVHIPRTGGSWFSYAWPNQWDKQYFLQKHKFGRHGQLSGILKKLDEVEFDYSDYKIVTIIREPIDRIVSAWGYYNETKDTAKRHGWKSIDDMLDEYESGKVKAHYLPQTYWLCEPDAKFDVIYRFEDLLKRPKKPREQFPKFNTKFKFPKKLMRGIKDRTSRITYHQVQRIKRLYKDDVEYLSKYYPNV